MILVTGGRGRIARATVERLRADDQPVRITSRSPSDLDVTPDVEVVEADIARTATAEWTPLLDGVTGVLLYADPSGVGAFVDAARSAGVTRIALVSAAVVGDAAATEADPIVQMHRDAESAVRASGVPWTLLRPGGLAGNTLGWADSIRRDRVVRAPYANAHAALVHEADVADVAALVLTDPSGVHAGEAYTLTGPASLPQAEQAELIGKAIGSEVRFEEITPEAYRQILSQWGDDRVVDALLRRLQEADGRPEPVSTTYEALLGRAPRSFLDWATDHADAFR